MYELLRKGSAKFVSETRVEILLPPSPVKLGRVDVKLLGVSIIDGGSRNFSILLNEQGDAS